MDISYFDEYIELARCLNFTEAAKNLSMTQSALSKHIVALEREFGCTLFDRNRHKVALTQAGAMLYDKAYVISQTYLGAKRDIAKVIVKPPIRISGLLQNHEVIDLLAQALELANSRGNGDSIFAADANKSPLSQLLDKDADLCIIAGELDSPPDSEIAFELLYNDPFVAMVARHHRFAGRKSISMDDLKNETLLKLIDEYSASAWNRIENVCKDSGFEPKTQPHFIKNYIEYTTVAIEDAVYIVPEMTMLSSSLRLKPNLVCVPIANAHATFPISAAYRKENKAKLDSFLQALHEAADSVMLRTRPANAYIQPFKTRCNRVSEKYSLGAEESQILIFLAKGHSPSRIVKELGISEKMAETSIYQLRKKLGVETYEELVDLIDEECFDKIG
ncbi:MAG: LysR family transcriptional regulator [Actinobacteria bacterium]|nr:LysR family transcriptional regulator [Actinomycetota bacterium]